MATLSLDLQFSSSINNVWSALTKSDLVAQWTWANDFKPVVGYSFKFRGEPNEWWNGTISGEVLEVEEPYKLVYTWEVGSEAHVVTWTLRKTTDENTLVHLEQTGITDKPEVLEGFKSGQLELTSKLKKLVDELY